MIEYPFPRGQRKVPGAADPPPRADRPPATPPPSGHGQRWSTGFVVPPPANPAPAPAPPSVTRPYACAATTSTGYNGGDHQCDDPARHVADDHRCRCGARWTYAGAPVQAAASATTAPDAGDGQGPGVDGAQNGAQAGTGWGVVQTALDTLGFVDHSAARGFEIGPYAVHVGPGPVASTIPAAAIEAAARALVGWADEPWDDYEPDQQDRARESVRAALSAAWPHLAPGWESPAALQRAYSEILAECETAEYERGVLTDVLTKTKELLTQRTGTLLARAERAERERDRLRPVVDAARLLVAAWATDRYPPHSGLIQAVRALDNPPDTGPAQEPAGSGREQAAGADNGYAVHVAEPTGWIAVWSILAGNPDRYHQIFGKPFQVALSWPRGLPLDFADEDAFRRFAAERLAELTSRRGPEPEPAGDLRTPDQWLAAGITSRRILDPDGWRGHAGRPWTDPISRTEFEQRLALCTSEGPPQTEDPR